MPASLLVEPAVLAFMGVPANSDSVTAAVVLLTEISSLLRSHPGLPVLVSPDLEASIAESGHFPLFDGLRDLLTKSGVGHLFDAPTVLAVVNGIIQRAQSVADVSIVNDLIWESYTIEPAPLHLEGNQSLADALVLLVAFCAAGDYTQEEWRIFSRIVLGTSAPTTGKLSYSCDVGLVDPPIGEPPVDAFHMSGDIVRMLSRRSFYEELDAAALWARSSNEAQIKLAISARAFQLKLAAGYGDTLEFVDNFVVGHNFVASLGGAQSFGSAPFSSAALQACARVVAGLPQEDVHPFYTYAGSGVQRKRMADGAHAFRVHVTKHGIGLRLMYWQLTDGRIELSNVAPKQDTVIFE